MAMNITKLIGKLAPEGIWVDYQDGVKIKLLDPTSKRAQHAITASLKIGEMQQMMEAGIQGDLTTPEGKEEAEKKLTVLADKFMGDYMDLEARTTACLILGWSGFADDADVEVEFSKDLAHQLCLLDHEFKAFVDGELNKLRDAGVVKEEKADVIKKK